MVRKYIGDTKILNALLLEFVIENYDKYIKGMNGEAPTDKEIELKAICAIRDSWLPPTFNPNYEGW